MGRYGLDSHLPQNRDQWRALANTVMNLLFPQNVGQFLSRWATGGFSRRTHFDGIN
jgi:hypothetical protein